MITKCPNDITTKTMDDIIKAINDGHLVTMRNDPTLCFCIDLFGNLVVMSRQASEEPVPVRLATEEDVSNASITNKH